MPYVLIGLVCVVVLAVGGVLAARSARKRSEESESAAVDGFIDSVAGALREDIEMLRQGNLGWRLLAKGKSTVGLSPLVPREGGPRWESYQLLCDTKPEACRLMERADQLIDHVRAAANRVGVKLQGPVKGQFDEDREHYLSDSRYSAQFRKALFSHEDTWMLVLRNLLNNGRLFEEMTGPYQKYWSERGEEYVRLLKENGGEDLEELKHRRRELLNTCLKLQDALGLSV